MKHYEKLNLVSVIIYAVVFAWNLLYFWVLAGPTGLMDTTFLEFIISQKKIVSIVVLSSKKKASIKY